ncbi:MAG: cysteine hydrolase family protein [Bryobacteraceae bacterium]
MDPHIAIPPTCALLLIDLQKAIDHPSWGVRNNPNAEQRAFDLLSAWRRTGRPLYHVKHDSTETFSTYRPGQPGNEFKEIVAPLAGETIITKHVHSAFLGTPLVAELHAGQQSMVVVCGVITNNSVEATVRHGADLGFNILLAEDACFTFARTDWSGVSHSAEEVHAMSLANMQAEYCRVVNTADVLAAL